ncbi:MAG: K+/H+ antiporter subunit F [Thiomonas sp.]|jgi:multicomponent K+:H+ antiporter subunit F
MTQSAVIAGFAMLTLAFVFALARLLLGPHAPDRVLALDTLYVNTVALLILLGVHLDSSLYFEAALLIALVGFVSTVALSKFLLRGDLFE